VEESEELAAEDKLPLASFAAYLEYFEEFLVLACLKRIIEALSDFEE
jgi:hypothetical protein